MIHKGVKKVSLRQQVALVLVFFFLVQQSIPASYLYAADPQTTALIAPDGIPTTVSGPVTEADTTEHAPSPTSAPSSGEGLFDLSNTQTLSAADEPALVAETSPTSVESSSSNDEAAATQSTTKGGFNLFSTVADFMRAVEESVKGAAGKFTAAVVQTLTKENLMQLAGLNPFAEVGVLLVKSVGAVLFSSGQKDSLQARQPFIDSLVDLSKQYGKDFVLLHTHEGIPEPSELDLAAKGLFPGARLGILSLEGDELLAKEFDGTAMDLDGLLEEMVVEHPEDAAFEELAHLVGTTLEEWSPEDQPLQPLFHEVGAQMTHLDFDSTTRPVNSAGVTVNGDGDAYPRWLDYMFGTVRQGGIGTETIVTGGGIEGSNYLQMTLLDGSSLYAQFNPLNYNSSNGLYDNLLPKDFARNYSEDPANWQFDTYNRLRFWIKTAPGSQNYKTDGQNNYNFGTYVKRVENPDCCNDEAGGGHYYHNMNLGNNSAIWQQVIINMRPDHRRGETGGLEYGVVENPTGEAQYNYFDALTRFYVTQGEGSADPVTRPLIYGLDNFKFYKEKYVEPDSQVSAIVASYDPVQNRILLTWMRNKNENAIAHEVRYAYADPHVIGWNAATPAPNGVRTPPGWQGYNSMYYDTTAIPRNPNAKGIYLAIKPENNSFFSVVFVPYDPSAPLTPDTTAPVISAVTSTNVTDRSAVIGWMTDEAANSQVQYRGVGTTTWSATALDSALVTSHTVTITGLSASTAYEFRVISADGANPPNQTVDGTIRTFTTQAPDLTAPVLSAITSTNITSNGAMITWSTNEGSDTQVEYGTTTAYGSSTTLNATMVTSHLSLVTGLQASTLYHYRVKSRDIAGNLQVSSDFTFTTTAAPAIPPGAVGFWTLEGNANDISGNNNNGTLNNGALFVAGGKVGQGLNVDGVNDYVEIGDLDQPGSFSIAFWVKPDALPSGNYSTVMKALDYGCEGFGSTLYCKVRSAGVWTVALPATLTLNQWTHIGFTYNGSQAELFVNGQSAGTASGAHTTTNNPLLFGSWDKVSEFFDGTLDEIGIWSRVLTAQEMQALFAGVSSSDTTPPTISAVTSSSITSTGATITWATTNEVSDTQIEYGLTTAYGSSTTLNTSMVTSHSQALSGLTAGTLYHYRVKSRDVAGNLATSADFTFTTGALPVISLVTATNITTTGATITWTTNVVSDSQVELGTTTSYGSSTVLNTVMVTSHSVALSGLTAGTLYHYRVKSRDITGNLATSADFTFTTAANGVPVLTAILANQPDVDTSTPGIQFYPNTTVTYSTTASDPNGDTVTVTWQYSTNGGATWTTMGTGLSTTFTYGAGSAGITYTWRATGTDPFNGTTTQTLTVNIIAVPDTTPPVVNAISTPGTVDRDTARVGLQVNLGSAVTYRSSATDASSFTWRWIYKVGSGPEVVYALGNGPTIPDASFTYGNNPVTYTWILRVTDAAGNQSEQSLLVEVMDYAPVISGVLPSYSMEEEAVLTVQVVVTSPLGHPVTLTLGAVDGVMPSFVMFDDQGLLTFSPVAGDARVYELIIFADDEVDLSLQSSFNFQLTVGVPALDVTPPVITVAPKSSNVTSNAAAITWSTDEVSDSQVEYGIAGAMNPMANRTVLDPALVINHAAMLTGLFANTTYVYRVLSRDRAGNLAISSPDRMFTTMPAPAVAISSPANGEIIQGTTVDVLYAPVAGTDMSEVDHIHFVLDGGPVVMDMDFDGAYQFVNVGAGAHVLSGYLVRMDSSKIEGTEFSVNFSTKVNGMPVAADQAVVLNEDAPFGITLSGSDPDSGDTIVGYEVLTQPSSGSLNVSGNLVTYVPNPDFNGTDGFTYRVKSSDGNWSLPATVTLTVNAVNDAPVASAVSVQASEDAAKAVVLAGTDVDGDALTYTIVSPPTNGTLTGSGANLTYTPTANFNGTDSFSYRVNDGTVNSPVAVGTINVLAVNDAPVADALAVSVAEDGSVVIMATGSDADGDSLSFSVTNQPANGTVVKNANGTFTYTPAANFNGTDSFSVVASDGTSDSAPALISVTVNAVNDAPVANAVSVQASEDTAKAIVLAGTDGDGDALTYTIVSPPTNGTLTGSGSNRTYTPNANFNGADSFSYSVNDGTVDSQVAVVTINIAAANDAPVANAQAIAPTEDAVFSGTLTANDVDGNALTYSVVAQGAKGTVTITNAATGAFTYTPNANANGADSFTFRVNDGTVNSAAATVTVNIAAVNDAPVANAVSVQASEDTAKAIVLAGTDGDGDSLTYTIVSPPTNGTLTGSGSNRTYTPNANFNGTDSFSYKVNDGTVDSQVAVVAMDVVAANDAPVANAQAIAPTEDAVFSGTLTANDVDGNALTYSVVAQGAKGTVTITNAATGAFTYTPNANANGADSFTFRVSDGTVNSAAALVSVTVTPVNDAPVANAQAIGPTEDTVFSGTLTASDIDGNALTYSIVAQGTKGTVTITNAASGAFTYTPNANANGADSFTFRVNDGTVNSAAATVTVNIAAVNDAPVADAKSMVTNEDTAQTVVLSGSDIDGNSLSFKVATPPARGTVVINGNTAVYTPAANFNGTDSFTVIASDGTVNSAPALVSVTVNSVYDGPVAQNQLVTTNTNTALVITLRADNPDGAALTYLVNTSTIVNGTLTGSGANWTYTPKANFNGTDTFGFTVTDGTTASSGTVSISVVTPPPASGQGNGQGPFLGGGSGGGSSNGGGNGSMGRPGKAWHLLDVFLNYLKNSKSAGGLFTISATGTSQQTNVVVKPLEDKSTKTKQRKGRHFHDGLLTDVLGLLIDHEKTPEKISTSDVTVYYYDIPDSRNKGKKNPHKRKFKDLQMGKNQLTITTSVDGQTVEVPVVIERITEEAAALLHDKTPKP